VNDIANINPIRYRSYYWDNTIGLYYLQSRYYDPQTGRFISPDSIDNIHPEEPNSLNLYIYCGNDPINYTDPTGECFLCKAWKGITKGVTAAAEWVADNAVKVGLTVASAAMVVGGAAAIVFTGGAALNLGMGLIGAGIGSGIGTWTADNALIGWGAGAVIGGAVGFTLGAGASMLMAGGTAAFGAAATTFVQASLITFVGLPLAGTALAGAYNLVGRGLLDQWEDFSMTDRVAAMQTTGIPAPLSWIASGTLTGLVWLRRIVRRNFS